MTAVYNENDLYAATWIGNLIAEGHIAPGDVDTRSIVDVGSNDYKGYTQVHLFAGIAGWSLAARLAGWPDSRPLWTGSCPCQPFSAAGKRKGTEDARHLWPEMRRLVDACRPAVVAGEQVASKDGRLWLAGVRTDLEALGYDVGAFDLCSAGVGAPHIRQRLWWLADAAGERRAGQSILLRPEESGRDATDVLEAAGRGAVGGLADADGGLAGHGGVQPGWQHGQQPEDGRAVRLVDAVDARLEGHAGYGHNSGEPGWLNENTAGPVATPSDPSFWGRYFSVVHCTDGKTRRFEPGSFPLAHGVSNRVGRLRAYGNAINPYLAAEVLGAYLDGVNKSDHCAPRVDNVDNAA